MFGQSDSTGTYEPSDNDVVLQTASCRMTRYVRGVCENPPVVVVGTACGWEAMALSDAQTASKGPGMRCLSLVGIAEI